MNQSRMNGMSKNNGKPKKPDARRISRKLKPKQRKFIAHYTDPTKETFGNGTKSAIAAGYTDKAPAEAAHQLLRNTQVERELNRILDAAGVTPEKLAKTVNQGLKAKVTKPFLHQATGKVVYSRPIIAHDIRLKAARLGFELRGDFAPKELNVSVTVIAAKLEAAKRRERERVVEGEVVKEEENNRPEADNLGGAPQAEEKTEEVKPSE